MHHACISEIQMYFHLTNSNQTCCWVAIGLSAGRYAILVTGNVASPLAEKYAFLV